MLTIPLACLRIFNQSSLRPTILGNITSLFEILSTNSTMQNATLHFCESSLFNSTNCPGAFEQGPPGGRSRCYTTSQVDVPQIALNYSQTNNGGQGMSCTDPVNKSAGSKVQLIHGLVLITLITCLMSAASALSAVGSCKSSQDELMAPAAPCDGQNSNLEPAP